LRRVSLFLAMTKDQLIEVAKAGFPADKHHLYNFETPGYYAFGAVFRLFQKEEIDPSKIGWIGMGLNEVFLAIHIEDESFVQIEVGNRKFNHRAAIKKMIELNLISTH